MIFDFGLVIYVNFEQTYRDLLFYWYLTIKYWHSLDNTQPFDVSSSTYQHLQQDDGNVRSHTSYYETNNVPETTKSSNLSRLPRSGNSNRLTDYSSQQISNELLLERRIYRDRAAAKIQAAYRGYSVRKSLPWLNDKQEYSTDEHKQRVIKVFPVE